MKRVPKNSEKNMMIHGLLLSKLMRPLQMRHRCEIGKKMAILVRRYNDVIDNYVTGLEFGHFENGFDSRR